MTDTTTRALGVPLLRQEIIEACNASGALPVERWQACSEVIVLSVLAEYADIEMALGMVEHIAECMRDTAKLNSSVPKSERP